MHKRIMLTLAFPLLASLSSAQQFAGFSNKYFGGVVQIPTNPSFVVKEVNGFEFSLAAVSVMAGTNAYSFKKDWLTDGLNAGPMEGNEFDKNFSKKNKHIWGNVDLRGPAVSFTLKEDHHLGIYTRARQIVRGGNVDNHSFQLIGSPAQTLQFPDSFNFENAGFTVHSFGEIGLTYGRQLTYDLNHIWKGGFTVKYLMGFAAGTLFTPSMELKKNSSDSTSLLKGELTALYTENIKTHTDNDPNNEFESWFDGAGGSGLGFDLGLQYEYHPIGDLYKKTPYTFRLAVSITDIGSIAYKADTGSGIYDVNIINKADWQYQRMPYEEYVDYFGRLKRDTLMTQKDSSSEFNVPLPTAFRLNTDWNINSNFWLGINLVLNMRGDNGNIYRPSYVNMLNITPRYEKDWFMVGMPVSFWGYQTMSIGAMFRVGPLFFGSTSAISTLIGERIRNMDAYAGLAFRFWDKKKIIIP